MLNWDPYRQRRRGRPSATWKRTVEAEIKEAGISWSEMKPQSSLALCHRRPMLRAGVTYFLDNYLL